ncbi:hypothetical protein F5Y17DRAFT_452592 [Xylariaceae sp. FL0594]|nr:hypothetical protein F5Y17DRAFT_452592 [Xylariaceae sp. FL0594]
MQQSQVLFCMSTTAIFSGIAAASIFATIPIVADVGQTPYDFIVVGGGIAGLTVADRLTEDPKSSLDT